MAWRTSKPLSEIYLEASDINLNTDQIESDVRLVEVAVKVNYSDVREVLTAVETNFSDVRVNFSDVREVLGAVETNFSDVRVNFSDVREVLGAVETNFSDVREVEVAVDLVASDTRLVEAAAQTTFSDVRGVWAALDDALTGSSTNVLISDATTDQIEMISDLRGADTLNISIENSDAGKILDAFEVAIQAHPSAAFQTVGIEPSDYTTSLQWPLLGCGGDLTTLDSDTAMTLMMACGGLNAVRLKASCNSGTTLLSTYWSAR